MDKERWRIAREDMRKVLTLERLWQSGFGIRRVLEPKFERNPKDEETVAEGVGRNTSRSPASDWLFNELERSFKERSRQEKLKVLEVGCGSLIPRQEIERKMKEWGVGAQIYSVDSRSDLAVLKEKRESKNEKYDGVCQANALRLPFGGGSMDVVYCYNIAHHLRNQDIVMLLREAWRVVKEGGEVIIADPRQSVLAPVAAAMMNLGRGNPEVVPEVKASFDAGLTVWEMRKMVGQAIGQEKPNVRIGCDFFSVMTCLEKVPVVREQLMT